MLDACNARIQLEKVSDSMLKRELVCN